MSSESSSSSEARADAIFRYAQSSDFIILEGQKGFRDKFATRLVEVEMVLPDRGYVQQSPEYPSRSGGAAGLTEITNA